MNSLFQKTSSHWVKYSEYECREKDGVLYAMPTPKAKPVIIDPLEDADAMVLDAVPGSPGRQPTGRMITLITSQDLLATDDRSVGFGTLVSAQPR